MTKKENNLNESVKVKKVYIIDFYDKRKVKKSTPTYFLNYYENNPESTLKEIENAIVKKRPKDLINNYREVNAKREASEKSTPYSNFRAYISNALKRNFRYYTSEKEIKETFGNNKPFVITRKGNFNAITLGIIEVNV